MQNHKQLQIQEITELLQNLDINEVSRNLNDSKMKICKSYPCKGLKNNFSIPSKGMIELSTSHFRNNYDGSDSTGEKIMMIDDVFESKKLLFTSSPVLNNNKQFPITKCFSTKNRETPKLKSKKIKSTNDISSDNNCLIFDIKLDPKYKSELCKNFEKNILCPYGRKCQFAHGYSEIRNVEKHPNYKTKPCIAFHLEGVCNYGHRCNFIHDEVDVLVNKLVKL